MIYLLIYILVSLTSQTLLKRASLQNDGNKNLGFLVSMYKNHKVILAYAISFGNIFIWVFALREVSLSAATLMASTNFVLIVLVDRLFFGEEIKIKSLIGVLLISMGVALDVICNE